MKTKPEALMRDLYNLIINPATRDWERHLLVQAKNNRQHLSPTGQLKQLEADLRPLAMRNNLTPGCYGLLSCHHWQRTHAD